ncbi:MAG: phosphotransferase [Planctomycetes bacterium]|nr:phosphotransferase [Planctomycetota bacterium]
MVPEYRDQLVGPDGLRLEEWLRTGQARVVKQGPHRAVYRVELPDLTCYLKHNLLHNTRAWLRQWIRPSKARMEYQRALALAQRQVPTVVPLALGERCPRWGPGESYLITRSLEDTVPLQHFLESILPALPAPRRTRVRQALAEALGRFMAGLHAAGVVHHDLHCGNLLVRLNEKDWPLLFLVDLHTVRLGPPLSWRARRANLVVLNRWFLIRSSRTDRLRFWRAYTDDKVTRWQGDKVNASGQRLPRSIGSVTLSPCHLVTLSSSAATLFRDRCLDLEERTQVSNAHFWRRRDRRCLEKNRYFRKVRAPGVVGHAVADLDGATLTELLADPDAPFHRPGILLRKDSRSSTVAEFDVPVAGRRCRVIYKRFRVTSWTDPWAALVRRTPALRSWVSGHSLRERCLPTPRPLAVLHRHRGLYQEGYLLMEKVPQAVDLHEFLTRLGSLEGACRRVLLRRHIAHLAILIRDLHQRSLAHRDLKASNILVQEPEQFSPRPCTRGRGVGGEGVEEESRTDCQSVLPNPGEPLFWLIDLVGVTRHGRVSRRRRLRNLARLHVSFFRHPALTRTDKLRFLRVYLQWGLRGKQGWKSWWREMERATLAKVARNLRRGRPLG